MLTVTAGGSEAQLTDERDVSDCMPSLPLQACCHERFEATAPSVDELTPNELRGTQSYFDRASRAAADQADGRIDSPPEMLPRTDMSSRARKRDRTSTRIFGDDGTEATSPSMGCHALVDRSDPFGRELQEMQGGEEATSLVANKRSEQMQRNNDHSENTGDCNAHLLLLFLSSSGFACILSAASRVRAHKRRFARMRRPTTINSRTRWWRVETTAASTDTQQQPCRAYPRPDGGAAATRSAPAVIAVSARRVRPTLIFSPLHRRRRRTSPSLHPRLLWHRRSPRRSVDGRHSCSSRRRTAATSEPRCVRRLVRRGAKNETAAVRRDSSAHHTEADRRDEARHRDETAAGAPQLVCMSQHAQTRPIRVIATNLTDDGSIQHGGAKGPACSVLLAKKARETIGCPAPQVCLLLSLPFVLLSLPSSSSSLCVRVGPVSWSVGEPAGRLRATGGSRAPSGRDSHHTMRTPTQHTRTHTRAHTHAHQQEKEGRERIQAPLHESHSSPQARGVTLSLTGQ